jgi:DNA-binding LytR/AlgR family response regulator
MAANLTYILADDDEMYRDYTNSQLQQIEGLSCLEICMDAISTRTALGHLKPDLLVLDIEMPGLSGIQLVKSLQNLPFIIFITSHKNYAADAFEIDAVDYLVKPVPIERMFRAIDKVKKLVAIQSDSTAQGSFQPHDNDAFFLKEKNVYHKIPFNTVLFAESMGDFVNFILEDGTKKIALVNMGNLEAQLPACFLRISRSHIVNIQKIKSLQPELVQLDVYQLPIGVTYRNAVMDKVVGNKIIKRFK